MVQKKNKLIFFIILVSIIISTINVTGCKDLVAVGEATKEDYNLLLKVRDPSRPGLQVLCIVPKGYSYSYNHPWTGKTIDYTVEHKFIGVATEGDTIPNIVKAGMSLSETGIAYGDADTNSNWKNPTRNAWDDFDWIRYACQKASDEEEAVSLLTKDLVDDLHASGVSENLFVVGPNKAYVVEADAFHYKIREVKDIEAMSNYPKELWKTQRHKKFFIASSFDIKKEQYVAKGRTIRLNSFYGVKIVDIGDDFIIARQVPFMKINRIPLIVGQKVKIELNKRETVGDFSVNLLDIDGRKAKISICTKFKAWEEKIYEYMQSRFGEIVLKDMFNWSRLNSEDLDGLRPMCEEIYPYEAVMVYKIPKDNFEVLSSGWFSANHASSSIYVPVHICNYEIYEPFKDGEAAQLSLNLLEKYGNDYLELYLENVEDVFLYEIENIEKISLDLIQKNTDISEFLTIIDMGIQKQAILTLQIWNKIQKNDLIIIKDIWKSNYSTTINTLEDTIEILNNRSIVGSADIIENIKKIGISICETRLNAAKSVGFEISTIKKSLDNGIKQIEENQYKQGFNNLSIAYKQCNLLLEGDDFIINTLGEKNTNDNNKNWIYFNITLIVILCLIVIMIFVKKKLIHK